MLGGFRILLAIVVVLYHVGYHPFSLQIGISAVVAFYMVSGYAMSALWRRWYADGQVAAFYLDRVLRLYPQYIAFCGVSAFLIFGLGIKVGSFQAGEPSWITAMAHVTIVPLSFGAVFAAISGFMLIPQAWSLGTEMMFYLIFPFVQSRAAMTSALLVSLTIFVAASTGGINPTT